LKQLGLTIADNPVAINNDDNNKPSAMLNGGKGVIHPEARLSLGDPSIDIDTLDKVASQQMKQLENQSAVIHNGRTGLEISNSHHFHPKDQSYEQCTGAGSKDRDTYNFDHESSKSIHQSTVYNRPYSAVAINSSIANQNDCGNGLSTSGKKKENQAIRADIKVSNHSQAVSFKPASVFQAELPRDGKKKTLCSS
jgi:hypothetical protein